MNSQSILILIGVTSLAIAAGVAVAMMQSPSKDQIAAAPAASSPSPSPIATQSPPPTAAAIAPPAAPAQPQPPAPVAKVPPSRQIESCVIKMATVDDPESPLNVRSSPTTANTNNIVGQVQNGTFLTVTKVQNGWLQITEPLQGWVAQSRTRNGCNEKIERVRFGTGNTSTEISDRFIGTGFHKYLFQARAGQTITVTRQSGPFPFITKPDGKLLADIQDDRDRWSGELPVSGDYGVQLDSNYKGYPYSFVVEIK
ncbi:MAG: SH3 domain-containing protein [Leptolyngbyaceae cyanobacterium bins.349]|nr:SH3 domain-containing protein [Leptolyngbyaceae cyanobacterium bins.349]